MDRPTKRSVVSQEESPASRISVAPSLHRIQTVVLPSFATLSSSTSHPLSIVDLLRGVEDSNDCLDFDSSPITESSSSNNNKGTTVLRESDDVSSSLEDCGATCSCTALTRLRAPPALTLPTHILYQHDNLPAINYMERQPDLNEHMRAILFDWLVEVAEEYKLKPSTLFLTTTIVDRFLSDFTLNRDKLQLVGVASLLIAARRGEINCPSIDDLVFVSDNAYTKIEIEDMLKQIINVLKSKITTPTTYTYLRELQKAAQLDEEVCQLSNYLAELTLLEYSFLRFEPMKIAASVVAVALHSTECVPWSSALEQASRFSIHQIRDCMTVVLEAFADAHLSQLQAIREKYSIPNPYLCVSHITPPDTIPAI